MKSPASLFILLSVLPLLPALPGSGTGLAAAEKPNLLFLIADDLATRLGSYGDAAAITPHLDRLAAEGVIFTKAYCQGAVCTPSRTSFMLGLNTRHAKSDHFRHHPDTMTMGRWFREHGYQTFSVGKIDHTEEYLDPQAWEIRARDAEVKPPVTQGRRISLEEDLGTQKRRVSHLGIEDQSEALLDWARAERAIRFFDEERDETRPFFAAIGFHSPHGPWDTTRAIHERHDPAKFAPEITPADVAPLPPGSLLHEPGLELSEARQREGLRGYYAAVTLLDEQIGRLLDHLRAKGQLDNTLVVFTSDHGYHLGWRGQWCKHSIDEQVMRVPLIVRHPQGAKGARAGGIVELLDLFPTFCDFAGLPAPETLDGKSFLPLLIDPKAAGKPGAFCQWGNGRTVRTQRWRLVERRDGSRELYDHSTDTAEYHNVIANPVHEALVERLHGMLETEFGPMTKAPAGKVKAN